MFTLRKMIVTISLIFFAASLKIYAASDEIRGLYLNAFSLSGPRFEDAIKIVQNTDINALVLDVKDVRGFLVYDSKIAKKIIPTAIRKRPKNLKEVVTRIKQRGDIYTIARVVVFKDNYYPERYPWVSIKNEYNQHFSEKNLKWIDPHNREYWDYIIKVAKECYDAGFDEVQFDYIRFPGTKKKLIYPHKKYEGPVRKSDVIAQFLEYANNKLSDYNKPLSIDVFGLVGNVGDNDLGVGQIWHKLSKNSDIISPMMYPSHYPKGFAGIAKPDLKPYEVMDNTIKRSIRANNKASKSSIIRPWIQAFSARWLQHHLTYNQVHLIQQINALKDNKINGYLVWHPGSKYRKYFPQVFRGHAQNIVPTDPEEKEFENYINYEADRLSY